MTKKNIENKKNNKNKANKTEANNKAYKNNTVKEQKPADTLKKQKKEKEIETLILNKSIEKAKERSGGKLSYDEFNDILPQDIVSSDQIDDLISMLGEKDIEIGRDTSSIFTKSSSMLFAISISLSRVSKATDPISFKYILTGSLVLRDKSSSSSNSSLKISSSANLEEDLVKIEEVSLPISISFSPSILIKSSI